jgi:hypothetical protein
VISRVIITPRPVGTTIREVRDYFLSVGHKKETDDYLITCPQRSGQWRDPKGSRDLGFQVSEGTLHPCRDEKMRNRNLIPLSGNFKKGLDSWQVPFHRPARGPYTPPPQEEGAGPAPQGAASPPRTSGPARPGGRAPTRGGHLSLRHVRRPPGSPKAQTPPQPPPQQGLPTAGEPRKPRELQGSSQTYSFPTACASRRGDVTGPGVWGGQAEGAALSPTAPPPARRGRNALPWRPAPLRTQCAGADGRGGRL